MGGCHGRPVELSAVQLQEAKERNLIELQQREIESATLKYEADLGNMRSELTMHRELYHQQLAHTTNQLSSRISGVRLPPSPNPFPAAFRQMQSVPALASARREAERPLFAASALWPMPRPASSVSSEICEVRSP